MKNDTFSLLVESWRGLAHSYALVNQFQCLELLKIPGLRLYHSDRPFYGSHWTASDGLFSPESEAALNAIPAPPPDLEPDAILRIAYPYDFSPSSCPKLCVFGTAENLACPKNAIVGCSPSRISDALRPHNTRLLTPSAWSRDGFVRSGAPPDKISIIPHGVDTTIFQHASPALKLKQRQQLGYEPEHFVFLNVGSLAPNKGAVLLLKTFAELASKKPSARLLLKFNGALYSPKDFMDAARRNISPIEQKLIEPRLRLLGVQHSLSDLALLYQASDAYVAPYYAEGFNIPALEACACGLPVLCTEGGPTDDFLPSALHLKIKSRRITIEKPEESLVILEPAPHSLLLQMSRCIEDTQLRLTASLSGPAHVQASYTWKHIVNRLLPELGYSGSELT